jgi:hypothetical protein
VICVAPTTATGTTMHSFHTGYATRSVHVCTLQHHICHNLKRDLHLVECILTLADTSRPIVHLIPRAPYDIA